MQTTPDVTLGNLGNLGTSCAALWLSFELFLFFATLRFGFRVLAADLADFDSEGGFFARGDLGWVF
ncbi:hypothetical protein XI00_05625 [Bradyrhizobium sp. CCBAU 21359]|nr:hypothetical protein [Bradyrhizobium sp. CCBAU 21359]